MDSNASILRFLLNDNWMEVLGVNRQDASRIIERLYDKMNHFNCLCITDESKEMGYSRFVDMNLVSEVLEEVVDGNDD